MPALKRAIDETETSFDALFIAQYQRLVRIICRVTGDSGTAEDLAAEAFWKLHRKPPSSNENLPAWLCRTGLRLALDSLKKQRRRDFYEAQVSALAAVAGPDEVLARREQQVRVRAVLSALKQDHAALLIMRSEGFTHGELAATLHLNPASIGTFLARAEAAFRKEYVKLYGEH